MEYKLVREIIEELGGHVEFHDNNYEHDSFSINFITTKCVIVKDEPVAKEEV